MTNCADIRKKLTAYCDGEVESEARALISWHLASCPSCREELERLTALRAELALIEDVEVRPYFMTRLKQRIADAPRSQKSESRIRSPASSFILYPLSFFMWVWRAAMPLGAAAVVFLTAMTGSYLGKAIYAWRIPHSAFRTPHSEVSAGSILFDESTEGVLTLSSDQTATGGSIE